MSGAELVRLVVPSGPETGGTAYGGLGVQPPIGDSLGGGPLTGATIETVEGGAARRFPLPQLPCDRLLPPSVQGGPGGWPTGGIVRSSDG